MAPAKDAAANPGLCQTVARLPERPLALSRLLPRQSHRLLLRPRNELFETPQLHCDGSLLAATLENELDVIADLMLVENPGHVIG